MQEAIFLILLILAIAYTGLTLYFENRQEKLNKEWQEKLKRTRNLKKN